MNAPVTRPLHGVLYMSIARRNEIGWLYLVHWARALKEEERDTKRLRDKFRSFLNDRGAEDALDQCVPHMWEFCDDLIAAAESVDAESGEIDASAFYLHEEKRHQLAYIITLVVIRHEGIHVGKSTKREVGQRAAVLNIRIEEMSEFTKAVVRDVLDMVLQ